MNQWDQRYTETKFFYGKDPNDFLKQESWRISEKGRVLCLAEGYGRNAIWLAKQGFRVTAVDGSLVAIQHLKEFAIQEGVTVECIHADLTDFAIAPNSWEGIISIWCHLPTDLRIQVSKKIVDGLKPNGIFIYESYCPSQLKYQTGGPKTLDLLPTVSDIKGDLSLLNLLVAQEIEREVHEGIGHNGMSAVLQFVAKKRS